MKTINKLAFALLFTFAFSFSTATAQNDTLYVMKNGVVVGKYNVNTQIDSIIFYQPQFSFTDPRDGNVYRIVHVGSQIWMAENMRYLPEVSGPLNGSMTTPYYYVYDYSGSTVSEAKATTNYTTYGVLYNWNAALDACPVGWHLPSDAEWTQLNDFLGGESLAGGKLKETGTSHWSEPNTDATNEISFSALPGGYRHSNGIYVNLTYTGYWWSSTTNPGLHMQAYYRAINNESGTLFNNSAGKHGGFSVRCLKD